MAKVVVQKFGGTSLSSVDRIRRVAQIIKNEYDLGSMVAVVVSAMAGQTNELVNYSKQFGGVEGSPEYDVVVSAGEQVTAGLIAQALIEIGLKARSFLAWQIPIITDDNFGKASVKSVNSYSIREFLSSGGIPVIPGFQGICEGGYISTLGRGGSDLTAVVMADELKAVRCDIFTDVDGVFTADPVLVPSAKKIDSIDYEDMLEFTYNGAKVLQSRSVEFAMKHDVLINVASSFAQNKGTLIGKFMSQNIVGIGFNDHLVKLKINPTNTKHMHSLLDYFNKNLIKFDIYSQETSSYTFILNEWDAQIVLESMKHSSVVESVEYIPQSGVGLAKITVIGNSAIKYSSIVAESLKKSGIQILNLLNYHSKVCFWVASDLSKKALNIVHEVVGLG